MATPTVSVIVPVHGETCWLGDCMDSIKTLTSGAVEIIVKNDPDGRGAAYARNAALECAIGEYVMFCDSDDYLEPGAIDLMLSAIDDADLLCGSFRKFGDFEQVVNHPGGLLTPPDVAYYTMSNLRNPAHHQMLSGCWAKLFRRELVRPFPLLTTAEDMAFNFDYLTRCSRVRFIPDVVYHNRKRSGSLSTTFDPRNSKGLFGFLDGLKYVKRFLEPFYPPAEIEDALDSSKVYHAMLYAQRMGPDALRRLYPL